MADQNTGENENPPCPICGGDRLGEAPSGPFCSSRCQMVDLNLWLGGHYTISRSLDQRDIEEGE